MAKLYFRYGAMNCGKTISLLQVAYNYEQKKLQIYVMKPAIDTKGDDKLVSRIGATRKVNKLIGKDEDIFKYGEILKNENCRCILVDEAQFLSNKQVEDLWKIVKIYDIPVICYGLRTDFQTHFFEGSHRLLELADDLEELVTICSCGKKAKFNARRIDDKYIDSGNQILIDGTSEIEY